MHSHHDHDHDHAAGDPHTHGHGHDHAHGHSHVAAGTDEWRILGAFLIIFVFMLVEIAGGLLSGSLALLADGGHMISDAAALAMSWGALRIGRRPADGMRSYGYRRLEVLVAFVNGCALFLIAAWVVIEAVRRFRTPVEVLGGPMLAVAVAGLVANAVAFWLLSGGNRENLSMRSAWLHVLGDLLGFAIAIVAAGVILFTGWSPIDPLLSVAVALLILRSAASIVRSSAHILLEGTPVGFDSEALRRDLLTSLPSVVEVHHIHAWSLTQEQPLVTLHVRCAEGADRDTVVIAVGQRLRRQFGITHATIQIDHAVCADEYCAEAPRRSSTG